MPTTYTAAKAASTFQARANIGETYEISTYEAATALALNDVIKMLHIPAGATIVGGSLSVDDLDTGTTIVLSVGDGVDVDRYIDSATIGQGGGTVYFGSGITGAAAAEAVGFQYTDQDTIDILVEAAPAGGGVGTLKLVVIYKMGD